MNNRISLLLECLSDKLQASVAQENKIGPVYILQMMITHTAPPPPTCQMLVQPMKLPQLLLRDLNVGNGHHEMPAMLFVFGSPLLRHAVFDEPH